MKDLSNRKTNFPAIKFIQHNPIDNRVNSAAYSKKKHANYI